jgi:hypothetical protein
MLKIDLKEGILTEYMKLTTLVRWTWERGEEVGMGRRIECEVSLMVSLNSIFLGSRGKVASVTC